MSSDRTPEIAKPPDILSAMTPEERSQFLTMAEAAESACAVCGWAVLAGGCPFEHPECPGFNDHKDQAP